MYSDEGRGRIRISVAVVGDALEVEIRDTGKGIPAALIQKIRDPFFTTKQVGEGTGLGLWISDNIVRAHGGTLRVTSDVGVGSAFTVSLPLRPAPATTQHA